MCLASTFALADRKGLGAPPPGKSICALRSHTHACPLTYRRPLPKVYFCTFFPYPCVTHSQATIAAARPVPPPQPAPQAYAGPPQYRTGAPQPTGPAPMPVAPQPQPATPTHAATAPPAPAIAQQPPSASRPQVISQHPQPPQQQQQQQPAPRPASHTPTQQQPATDKPYVAHFLPFSLTLSFWCIASLLSAWTL